MVEDAIETSMNSSGSALEENAKWLDSIEGKTYQFTNALQAMWNNMINAEIVKDFIDFGTNTIKFLDSLPGKIAAVSAAFVGLSKLKGYNILNMGGDLWNSIKNIGAAQSALNSLQATFASTSAWDVSHINAYADAVSALTAREQASLLAKAGLNKAQIEDVMIKNDLTQEVIEESIARTHATGATNAEIVAKERLLALQVQLVAQSYSAGTATLVETTAEEANIIATQLAAIATENLTKEKLEEVISSLAVSEAAKAEARAKLGLAASNVKLGASLKGLFVAHPLMMAITIATTALIVLPKIIDAVTVSTEELKEEVDKLTDTYETAKKSLSDNIDTLSISSDKDVYKDLESEFSILAKGVDEYGNNISLTSDQYERYKAICEQIVGVNPDIAAGYDSAAQAIGNNASALRDLLELQKEELRLKAQDYVSDENIGKQAVNANNNYISAQAGVGSSKMTGARKLYDIFKKQGEMSQDDDIMRFVLDTILPNATPKEINSIIQSYWVQAAKEYDATSFFRDYSDEIQNNLLNFGAEYSYALNEAFGNIENAILSSEKVVKTAEDGLIKTFLQVPTSLMEYDKLTDSGKKFINEWIRNDNSFKVSNNQTEEAAITSRELIENMILDLPDVKGMLDGKQITGQELLDSIYSFDLSTVSWKGYEDQMGALVSAFWQAIGGADNKYGIDSTADLASILGIDIIGDGEAIAQATKQIAGHIDMSQEQIQQKLDSMSAKQVKAYYSIDWNEVDWDDTTSWQDVVEMINYQIQSVTSVKTYSVLSESVASYNELLMQTKEIVTDNTEITQEYKDSILALGVNETELNECLDENNRFLVKDAKALNNLVKSSKNNTAQNIKLAKSQARLQYYELYKEMRQYTNGQKVTNASTLAYVNSLYSQMSVLQKTIAKYSLLEAELLDAANAYDEFASAQEADSAKDYMSTAEEMVNVIANAFNTGELGTEAAQAAIKAMVPEEIYSNVNITTNDEAMDAVYKYFTEGTLSKYFTLEFDDEGAISSVETTLDDIKEFVNDGLSNITLEDGSTIFQGTLDEFTLNPQIDSIKEFADAWDMTETMAFSFLTKLEDYDIGWIGGDGSTLLDQLMGDNLEYQIYDTTQKLAELEVQMANGKISAEEYAQTFGELSNKEVELAERAREEAVAYYETSEQLEEYNSQLEEYYKQLKSGVDSNGNIIDPNEVQKNIDQVVDNIDTLTDNLKTLEEPTELKIEFALKGIQNKLDEIEKEIGDVIEGTHYTLDIETGMYTVMLDESDPNYQQVKQFVDYLNQQHTIETKMGSDTPTVTDQLQTIADILQQIADKLQNKYTINIQTSTAIEKINGVISKLGEIKDRTVSVFTNYFTRTPDEGDGAGVNGTAHVRGTAFKGGSWGAPRTETALVGELGPEMRVRGNRWELIGQNGAEFTDVRKGDIIFNHKQTEDLLSKGYVTGRGKAYAGGTAYAGIDTYLGKVDQLQNDWSGSVAEDLSDAAESLSDAADEFEEVFDWVEVRLEEIEEQLSLLNAQLENTVGYIAKNQIIDATLNVNNIKLSNLQAGLKEYEEYATALLTKVPSKYRDAAQNGAIAIEEFVGETDEKTLQAIQDYREWAQKAADLKQQIEETKTEIADLAKQKFDNVADEYDNIISLTEAANDKLDAQISLMEDRGYVAAKEYYEAMADNTKKTQAELVKERDTLQSILDEQVKLGNIKVGSEAWYEMVQQLYDVDAAIVECTSDLESFQNAINDIYWDNFDELISRYDYLSDETQNLIDLMDDADMVSKPDSEDGWASSEVTWTDEGIASLGLYAQQMEIAEYKSKQYAKAIEDLNKDYADGKYSESEYLEKLNELKDGQYDSIEAYKDAKKAIKDLNSEMVDAVKDGLEKQIDAYSELADKRKEALDAEKDAYDWQKSISKQQKSISDIDRQIAALSGDTSISAAAKRKQLEAERAELQAELDEMYYDRSVENQKEAIDKELEIFTEAREKEIEQWEKYLEDVEKVVTDSLNLVQANASTVYDTLNGKANEYGLNVSEAVTSPWTAGENAISNYTTVFGDAASSTTGQLKNITLAWQAVIDKMTEAAEVEIEAQKTANAKYVAAKPETTNKPATNTTSSSATNTTSKPANNKTTTAKSTPSVGQTVKVKKSATHFSAQSGNAKMASFVPGGSYQVMQVGVNGDKSQILIGKNGQYTGWVKLTDLEGYAKGTLGVSEDQFAWLDEIGEELVMHANNGRLSFLTKGSSVIPADLTERLMDLAMNPQDVLDRNRPQISMSPSVTTNNIELNLNVGEIVHVDTVTNDTIPNLTKAIDKQLDKYMKQLNGQIRRYAK